MSGQIRSKIVTDSLILHLDTSNPKSYAYNGARVWKDLSKNVYDFTLTGTNSIPIYDSGGISFNGVNQYAYITNSAIKNYTTITATIWMKVNYDNYYNVYFSYNSEQGALSKGWGIRYLGVTPGNNEFEYWGGAGNTGIKIYKNDRLLQTANSDYGVTDGVNNILNTWQMLTLIATGVSSWDTTNVLSIAAADSLGGLFTKCNVGMFLLYNKELSPSEILQNYNSTKAQFGL